MPSPTSARPRLLLGCYTCHPTLGSEPFVGWNRVVQAARFGDVDVLLCAGEAEAEVLEAAVEREGLSGRVRFHTVEHTKLERVAQRVPGGFYPTYRRWQRRALRLAQRLHARRPYDLAHQVTFCGYREPGDLWRLDVPFVWGPVGGTQNTPAAFLDTATVGMAVTERLRTVANRVQLRGRRVRQAAAAADVLLAANSTGKRDLEGVLGRPVRQLLETGTGPVGVEKRWAEREPGPFRLLWAGQLNPTKGLRLAVQALADLRAADGDPDVKLIVVGDGPERDVVADVPGVDWRGWIPRPDLIDLYAKADAFAFTSLRDTSGNVMLEALAAGLPVVYLDHQGAHDVCSGDCGVPVPVTTPDDVVRRIAQAVTALATDPARYDRLSRGAIERARSLGWRANGDAVNALYAQALGLDPGSSAHPAGDGALLTDETRLELVAR
ncbi:glycosyltransferase family 4 protein [Rubrivirga sp.]|uniref:glycosyltransferase family 4 protein n=1 Tax=Rubrivirga sp. TaxID=1885344 RepID=UPI003B52402E